MDKQTSANQRVAYLMNRLIAANDLKTDTHVNVMMGLLVNNIEQGDPIEKLTNLCPMIEKWFIDEMLRFILILLSYYPDMRESIMTNLALRVFNVRVSSAMLSVPHERDMEEFINDSIRTLIGIRKVYGTCKKGQFSISDLYVWTFRWNFWMTDLDLTTLRHSFEDIYAVAYRLDSSDKKALQAQWPCHTPTPVSPEKMLALTTLDTTLKDEFEEDLEVQALYCHETMPAI